jgi:DNA polymerase V
MRRTIPINVSTATPEPSACDGTEAFALMVLGDAMLPEFAEGHVVIIEPGGRVTDGSYVLARVDDEWTLRQLCSEAGVWHLRALNSAYPDVAIADLSVVHGVVIQRVQPGRRRERKHYVD